MIERIEKSKLQSLVVGAISNVLAHPRASEQLALCPNTIYIPSDFVTALTYITPVIVGEAGVGKTYLAETLLSINGCDFLAKTDPGLFRLQDTHAHAAYMNDKGDYDHPSPQEIREILREGIGPYMMWRSVIAHGLAKRVTPGAFPVEKSWLGRAKWARENHEVLVRFIERADAELEDLGEKALFVFDGLESASTDSRARTDLIEAACELANDLRLTNVVRAKVFLRPDQLRDASRNAKFEAARIRWTQTDLYAMLWKVLLADPTFGAEYRVNLNEVAGYPNPKDVSNNVLPFRAASLLTVQRDLLNQIIAPVTGRENPSSYADVFENLSDAKGIVVPSEFLTAIREAALSTASHRNDFEYTITPDHLPFGYHAASEKRIALLERHYPGAALLLKALGGANSPLDPDELGEAWYDLRETLGIDVELATQRLVDLGVASTDKDDNITIANIYRHALGIYQEA